MQQLWRLGLAVSGKSETEEGAFALFGRRGGGGSTEAISTLLPARWKATSDHLGSMVRQISPPSPLPERPDPLPDSEIYRDLARQSCRLQSRRLKDAIIQRVAASRARHCAAERLALAEVTAESLYRRALQIQARGQPDEVGAPLLDSSEQARLLLEADDRLYAWESRWSWEDRTLYGELCDSRAAQVQAVSELRSASVRLRDSACTGPGIHPGLNNGIGEGDAGDAGAAVPDAVVATLPALLQSCADELAGSSNDLSTAGTVGGTEAAVQLAEKAWADGEASLFGVLLPLTNPQLLEGCESPPGEWQLPTSSDSMAVSSAAPLPASVGDPAFAELRLRLDLVATYLEQREPPLAQLSGSADLAHNDHAGVGNGDREVSLQLPSCRNDAHADAKRLVLNQLELLTHDLAEENEELSSQLCAELAQRRKSDEEISAEASLQAVLNNGQDLHERLLKERSDLRAQEKDMRTEAAHLQEELNDARCGLQAELTCVNLLRAEECRAEECRAEEDRAEEYRLEGVLRHSAIPVDAIGATGIMCTASGAPMSLSTTEDERLFQKLKNELADTYTFLANRRQHPQEDFASLRRECEALEGENAVLHAAMLTAKVATEPRQDIATAGVASQSHARLSENGSAGGPMLAYARLKNGKEVELTGMVHRQVVEIADLRARLREAGLQRANSTTMLGVS